MSAPTFREQMLNLHGEEWVSAEEDAFADKFPRKVTAEDVYSDYYSDPLSGWAKGAAMQRMCAELAKLRNDEAARLRGEGGCIDDIEERVIGVMTRGIFTPGDIRQVKAIFQLTRKELAR